MLYSIGELIDKIVVENIKIFTLREKLNTTQLTDSEFVATENKMNTINENRSLYVYFLNKKIDNVFNGEEQNVLIKDVKTYA